MGVKEPGLGTRWNLSGDLVENSRGGRRKTEERNELRNKKLTVWVAGVGEGVQKRHAKKDESS